MHWVKPCFLPRADDEANYVRYHIQILRLKCLRLHRGGRQELPQNITKPMAQVLKRWQEALRFAVYHMIEFCLLDACGIFCMQICRCADAFSRENNVAFDMIRFAMVLDTDDD